MLSVPFTIFTSADIQLTRESRVHVVIVASVSAAGSSASGSSESSSSSNSSQPSGSSGPVVSPYREAARSSARAMVSEVFCTNAWTRATVAPVTTSPPTTDNVTIRPVRPCLRGGAAGGAHGEGGWVNTGCRGVCGSGRGGGGKASDKRSPHGKWIRQVPYRTCLRLPAASRCDREPGTRARGPHLHRERNGPAWAS